MKKNLLIIDACIRENSRTQLIGKAFIDEYMKANSVNVDWLSLQDMNLKPHSRITLAERERICNDIEAIDESYLSIHAKKFAMADRIIVLAPYWEWSFPSILKVYIENASLVHVTYYYDEKGAHGLCRAEKLLYITTAGGIIGNLNLGYDYIKSIAEVFGIPHCDLIKAEGLDIIGADIDRIVDDAIKEATALAQVW